MEFNHEKGWKQTTTSSRWRNPERILARVRKKFSAADSLEVIVSFGGPHEEQLELLLVLSGEC